MKSLLILSLLTLSLCGFGSNMGSWQKDTFESNDMRIDRARATAEDDFKAKANLKDDEAEIYEIAVYHQLVNGMNYKIFFAVRDANTNTVDLYDYVVYSGPFGSEPNGQYEILSSKKLPIENNLSINSAKFGKLNDACAKYVKDTKGEKLAYVSTVRTNQNVIYSMSIYVVEVQTMAKRMPETVIVVEDEDGKFEVVATLVQH